MDCPGQGGLPVAAVVEHRCCEHVAGDTALVEVARVVRKLARTTDYVARYGGEEFVIVLPGFNKLQATEKAEQIRSKMKQTTYLARAGHNVHLGASFGLATFPEDPDNRTGLLALADQAMFRIKQTGKDSIGITKS